MVVAHYHGLSNRYDYHEPPDQGHPLNLNKNTAINVMDSTVVNNVLVNFQTEDVYTGVLTTIVSLEVHCMFRIQKWMRMSHRKSSTNG